MRLFGYFRSSAAYRCRIAFNLKGLTPAFEPVHLRKGEQRRADFATVNPQQLVPALDTGEGIITQSLAIIEWLDEVHPQPPLLPIDPFERGRARAFALAIACDIHPINNLRVLNYLKQAFGANEAAVETWYRHWIAEGLAACEVLAERSAGRFVCGDVPTVADICLVPQLYNARRYRCDLSAYPRLLAIDAACAAIPAFSEAHPDRQPDAE